MSYVTPPASSLPGPSGSRTTGRALVGLIAVAATLLAWQVLGGDPIEFAGLSIDRLSMTLALFITTVGSVVHRFAGRALQGHPRREAFLALHAFAVHVAFVLASAVNLLTLAVMWVLMGVLVHQLLLVGGSSSEARRVARRKFVLARVGDAALLCMLAGLAWWGESLELHACLEAVHSMPQRVMVPIGLLLAVSAMARSVQVPFHAWLPDSMEAPTPVSALLHAGVVNAGGILLIRFAPLLVRVPEACLLLSVAGTLTIMVGTLAMSQQVRLKQALAWSTVAQMGFMVVQCAVAAFPAALLHLIGHGAYKAMAFLRSGEAPSRVGASGPPWRNLALLVMGTACSLACMVPAARWTGFSPLHSPGEVALAWVVAVGVGQIWSLAPRSGGRVRGAIVAVGAAAVVPVTCFAAYGGVGVFLRPVLGDPVPSGGWMTVAAALLPALGITLLAIAHASRAWLERVPVWRSLLVQARSGFHVARWMDRALHDTPHRGAVIVNTRHAGSRIAPERPESCVTNDIDRVCLLVPPLWQLDRFVAVNPFLGFVSRPVHEAARAVADALDARLLPSLHHYRRLWVQGNFRASDIARAATRCGMHASHLEAILSGQAMAPVRPGEQVLTRAESIDQACGTRWETIAREAAAGWCAMFAVRNEQQTSKGLEGRLFSGWLADAAVDRSLEAAGLSGFRQWVRRVPSSADQAVTCMMHRLQIAPWDRQAYLYRLLGGVHGWASHFRRLAWPLDREDPGLVREVLAIRACLDAAVSELAPRLGRTLIRSAWSHPVEDERLRLVLQDAVEDAHARRLATLLCPPGPAPAGRPSLQAAFCIDVRSEPLRRHLEACDAGIRTVGFAGFFGVAVRWHHDEGASDRCPVLLRPSLQLRSSQSTGRVRESLLASLLQAPGACFPAVETLGLGSLVGLVWRATRAIAAGPRIEEIETLPDPFSFELSRDAAIEMAVGMLRGMAMCSDAARLVLLCGHQGRSENNPHAAALDCGACGGHGGALNARLAVRVLNDAGVRQGLQARGLPIPEDTVFIAGVHDTSTDEVRLLDADRVPESHRRELAGVRRWLDAAGDATRRERACTMSLDASSGSLERQLADRAGDWSQTRPEWALARNMAFVVARRSRTVGRNLQGRAFLHEYDAAQDTDLSVLSLILSAPMVVASWINLQYFASTVDNAVFGSGDKMLHNRVGNLGVVAGNGSDLRSGLPLQSVQAADGTPFHEPIRLQVFVEAPVSRIEAVLQSQPAVRDLIENGWVRLFALSPDGATVARRMPGLGWEPFVGEEATIEAASAAFAS